MTTATTRQLTAKALVAIRLTVAGQIEVELATTDDNFLTLRMSTEQAAQLRAMLPPPVVSPDQATSRRRAR